MNYENALKVHNIIKEIEKNNKDIRIFEEVINKDIVTAQITISCKNGIYNSFSWKITKPIRGIKKIIKRHQKQL